MALDFEKFDFDDSEWMLIPPPSYAFTLCSLESEIKAQLMGRDILMKVTLNDGEIVQYGPKDDGMVAVYYDNVTLSVSRKTFESCFLALPEQPNHLRYCSFDEFFGMEPGDFWVLDFKSGTFISTEAVIEDRTEGWIAKYLIDQNYNEDNYGQDWIALVADD